MSMITVYVEGIKRKENCNNYNINNINNSVDVIPLMVLVLPDPLELCVRMSATRKSN